jgi:hypothetical protein
VSKIYQKNEHHDKFGNTLLTLVRLIVKLHDQGDMPSSVFEQLSDCIKDGIIK